MQSQPENTFVELFIRTTTASKPTGPLKLMANVVGRFIVGQELSEKITKRIHDKTVAAQKQKSERKTQILDPSSVLSKGKGSKARASTSHSRPSLNLKAAAAVLPLRHQVSNSATDASISHDLPLRKLLIHRLALGSQTLKQLLEAAASLLQSGTARADVVKLLYEARSASVVSVTPMYSLIYLYRLLTRMYSPRKPRADPQKLRLTA